MNELAAALLATGCAYLLNRWGIKRFGLAEVVWVGPLVEEFAKTGLAWLTGAGVWWVHILFGVIEGFLDIRSGGRHRFGAALASIIGHGIFGFLTVWMISSYFSWWTGIFFGVAAHMLWNSYVLVFMAKRSEK